MQRSQDVQAKKVENAPVPDEGVTEAIQDMVEKTKDQVRC